VAGTIRARHRAAQVIKRPRLLLLLAVCGAMLVVAMTAVVASGAYFTATSVDTGNIVAAGGVKLTLAPSGQIVDLSDLAPGDSRSGTVEVLNTISEAAVSLSVVDLQQAPLTAGLDRILDVEVRETTPGQAVRYVGKLGDLHGVAVGTLGEGGRAAFVVTVSWPDDEDERSRQGATAEFVFEWTAVST
jgi:hypothetical protein